jgi:hypothetical protein
MPQPPGMADSAANLAHLGRLSVLRDQARHRALTEDEQAELDEHHHPCLHCGGFHIRQCPRVRRIVFNQTGQGIHEVEYFPASEIDWTGVVFEDEAGADDEQNTMMLVPGDLIGQATDLSKSESMVALEQLRRLYLMWLEEAEPRTVQSGHGPA